MKTEFNHAANDSPPQWQHQESPTGRMGCDRNRDHRCHGVADDARLARTRMRGAPSLAARLGTIHTTASWPSDKFIERNMR